eukprot:gene17737-24097_t
MTTNNERLRVQLLNDRARAPERKTPGAAGYDMHACEAVTVMPSSWGLVDTGIAIAIPAGTYGRVAPRSGLAVRGVHVGAGVIDEDYRGPVKVLLFNHSSTDCLKVEIGDRIAQLVLEVIRTPDVVVVDTLDETTRGEGGFGSTGR